MIGYISDNLLLPILDFFYGLVPSYGLAIIALTVVIRLALFPLSAGSIRSARRWLSGPGMGWLSTLTKSCAGRPIALHGYFCAGVCAQVTAWRCCCRNRPRP